MMACVAANIVGIKRTGMTTILGMLNILPPVQIENWNKYQKIYSDALDVVKDESLGRAADEAAEQSSEPADHEGVTNIKVSIDGTWLTRRGHSSLHGIATVCSTSDPSKCFGILFFGRTLLLAKALADASSKVICITDAAVCISSGLNRSNNCWNFSSLSRSTDDSSM
ncbi:unnamed protein product [Adineta steineri]|uniref:Mutator-like transposase domain-containing protein n=1 Tax=Adineta steineri TaxID=433720 RepID=A0A813W821_9BILA|nr:unnamed protein product [Adineta steineri]